MPEETLKVAALGRPFTLGMLYDARLDQLIPGFTLWDIKTLQENTAETTQHSSDFHITSSDSIESKSSLLDVEASLKASFMGGLITVGGSAKYLNDQKKFHNQSRITFQYKATTNFKQLSMVHLANLDEQQKSVLEKSSATHVVTGILYGANAVFVFDSEKLDASNVQDIQGSMEAVIKKIPSLDIRGEAKIKLTDEEKDLTNKFSCKFYGDLILESNPATFVEAVKTYVDLPGLLGEKKEIAVPLKVWLLPLKNLDSTAAELQGEVSSEILTEIEDALEGLRQIDTRCNDSLEDSMLEKFPQIRKSLTSFQKKCKNYTSSLQKTIKKTLPSIRDGKEDDSAFEKFFEDRDQSPFSHDKLSKWMDHKEREINVIRSCIDMIMEGTNTKIVPKQSALDREVFAPGVKNALCFVFTSLGSTDSCLDAMKNYLRSPDLRTTDEDPWYFSDEVLTKMREKAKAFHDLAKPLKNSSTDRFLVAATANEKYKGATIYHYKNGKLVTQDFSKPAVPPVKSITDGHCLMWYACDLHLDPNTVNGWLTLSDNNKKATSGEWQEYPSNPERFESATQVLCGEGLTGRHYWEVEWDNAYGTAVGVAVAYKRIPRTGKGPHVEFGSNHLSWYFGAKTGLSAQHRCQEVWTTSGDASGYRKVGVYLDWPAGTLSFYDVSSNKLSHLYTFNDNFTEPLYPGFYSYDKPGYVSFCPMN